MCPGAAEGGTQLLWSGEKPAGPASFHVAVIELNIRYTNTFLHYIFLIKTQVYPEFTRLKASGDKKNWGAKRHPNS